MMSRNDGYGYEQEILKHRVLGVPGYETSSVLSMLTQTSPDCQGWFKFVPSQWETALLCNDVSHWLGPSLESALTAQGFLVL